jgi:predicted nucleotidyltransferase
MLALIQNKLQDIIKLCKEHNVKSISLFGSAANENMKKNSDIDFLVQFSEDIELLDYADNYFSLLEGLEKTLRKKIHLVSVKSLKNPILKDEINRSKIDLYAA